MLSRLGWTWIHAILQSEQLQNKVHFRILSFHGIIHTTILQWIHSHQWLWTCSHKCKMGKQPIHTYKLYNTQSIILNKFHAFLFGQFNDMINVPFSSEAFVAGLLALFLDSTLHSKDSASQKDRGMPWWQKFRSFKTDTRSEEFYSLPCNLNKFFPSV